MYQVKTQQFSGPLEKLLELIESKKLDITGISLAAVTADFIAYVEELKQKAGQESDFSFSSRALAEFLVMAAHLVLIKSKELLPDFSFTQEEQEQVEDLERRLKLYSTLKPLFVTIRSAWQEAPILYGRELFATRMPIFYPPASLKVEDLHTALGSLLQSLGSLARETEHIERNLISLEEKITELSQQIIKGIAQFSRVTQNRPKGELIVLFLALLHLLREQTVIVKQDRLFGEIEMEQRIETTNKSD
jgi:segregation and condensation protein A